MSFPVLTVDKFPFKLDLTNADGASVRDRKEEYGEMKENRDLRDEFGKMAVFIAAILAVVGAVVVIPAGGAILLAELSGPSAKPHCSYRTGNRACVKPTTTAGAVRGKAAIRAAVKKFYDENPGLYEPRIKVQNKTLDDLVNYGDGTLSLRDLRPISRPHDILLGKLNRDNARKGAYMDRFTGRPATLLPSWPDSFRPSMRPSDGSG